MKERSSNMDKQTNIPIMKIKSKGTKENEESTTDIIFVPKVEWSVSAGLTLTSAWPHC